MDELDFNVLLEKLPDKPGKFHFIPFNDYYITIQNFMLFRKMGHIIPKFDPLGEKFCDLCSGRNITHELNFEGYEDENFNLCPTCQKDIMGSRNKTKKFLQIYIRECMAVDSDTNEAYYNEFFKYCPLIII